MASTLPADLVDAVEARSKEKISTLMREVAKRQIRPDGTTYGDVELSRPDRILRFKDFAERGVLDMLRVVKPDLLKRMIAQYQRDIRDQYEDAVR